MADVSMAGQLVAVGLVSGQHPCDQDRLVTDLLPRHGDQRSSLEELRCSLKLAATIMMATIPVFRVGSCWVFIANIFVSPHQQTVQNCLLVW